MSRKLTTEEFIETAKSIHGNRYDYSKVAYKGREVNVEIICHIHGSYFQQPKSHLKSFGCPKCSGVKKLTTREFIERAERIHGKDIFSYEETRYVNARTPVTIKCVTHGKFKQFPTAHLLCSGGCPKCSGKFRYDTISFTEKATDIHGDKYSYSEVSYKHGRAKIKIICKKHGIFKQAPELHLRGVGCPICNESHGEKKIRLFLNKNHYNFKVQFSPPEQKFKFDFVVLINNSEFYIEFHGRQHYQPSTFGSKKEMVGYKNLALCMERDFKKQRWCIENGKKLLIIPYWEFDRIHEILKSYLNDKDIGWVDSSNILEKYSGFRFSVCENFGINPQPFGILTQDK